MKSQKLEVNNDIDNENEQMVLKIIGKLLFCNLCLN